MSTSRGGTLERGGAVERGSTIERGSTLQMGGTLERGGAQLRYSGEGNESLANHAQLQHTNSSASAATPAVVPPPYSTGGAGGGAEPAGLELRDSLDCWACSVLVTAQNMVIAAINLTLAAAVFGLILTPAIFMVTFGFLCHSTVRPHGTSELCSELLSDGGCVALLVIGFLLVTPLLVLALAAYCRLARHLQLGLCFIPYSRAVYKNLPASRHHGLPCCSQVAPGSMNKGSVWV